MVHFEILFSGKIQIFFPTMHYFWHITNQNAENWKENEIVKHVKSGKFELK